MNPETQNQQKVHRTKKTKDRQKNRRKNYKTQIQNAYDLSNDARTNETNGNQPADNQQTELSPQPKEEDATQMNDNSNEMNADSTSQI